MLTHLVVIAALAAAPAPSDEKVWELIFQLEGDKSAAATEQLKPIALRAMPSMLKAARAAGMDASLASNGMLCGMPIEHTFMMLRRGGETAGMRAGGLLLTLARADPALNQALSVSPDPLGRVIALLTADREKPAFQKLLEGATRDSAPQVVRLAAQLAACPSKTPYSREIAESLGARQKELDPLARCDNPSQAGPFVQAFYDGGLKATGWRTSGDQDAWVTTASGSELKWPCAVAIYSGLVGRGRYEPSLLLPLVEARMPADARKAAGELLQRDEGKYPEKKRDDVASKLVVAGFTSSAKEKIIVPDNPTYAKADTLAAAALQKAPGAREAIEKRFICRGHALDESIALLGFAPSQSNADAAMRIAELCKEGRVAAVGALIRMKDPRAVQLLPSVIDDPWVTSVLGPPLRDNWSADWEKALRAHSKSRNFAGLVEAAGHPELKAP
jgi:hypothetical protein